MGQLTSYKVPSELFRVGYFHNFELHFIRQRNFLYLQPYTIHYEETVPAGSGLYRVSVCWKAMNIRTIFSYTWCP